MGRMRCLKGLGDWQRLNTSCADLLRLIVAVDEAAASNINTSFSSKNSLLHKREGSTSVMSHLSSFAAGASSSTIENIVVIGSTTTSLVLPSMEPSSYLRQLSSGQRAELREKVCEIGAAACWGLGDWDQMKGYAKNIPSNSYDGSLYSCVLSLTSYINNNSGSSSSHSSAITNSSSEITIRKLIDKTRDLLDGDLTSMASQSYERSYQGKVFKSY
jgi:hypothetical protein